MAGRCAFSGRCHAPPQAPQLQRGRSDAALPSRRSRSLCGRRLASPPPPAAPTGRSAFGAPPPRQPLVQHRAPGLQRQEQPQAGAQGCGSPSTPLTPGCHARRPRADYSRGQNAPCRSTSPIVPDTAAREQRATSDTWRVFSAASSPSGTAPAPPPLRRMPPPPQRQRGSGTHRSCPTASPATAATPSIGTPGYEWTTPDGSPLLPDADVPAAESALRVPSASADSAAASEDDPRGGSGRSAPRCLTSPTADSDPQLPYGAPPQAPRRSSPARENGRQWRPCEIRNARQWEQLRRRDEELIAGCIEAAAKIGSSAGAAARQASRWGQCAASSGLLGSDAASPRFASSPPRASQSSDNDTLGHSCASIDHLGRSHGSMVSDDADQLHRKSLMMAGKRRQQLRLMEELCDAPPQHLSVVDTPRTRQQSGAVLARMRRALGPPDELVR
eukprot:TRINITY_DN8753_c0_g1_i1.p1 TRINITY_DN8753_c0_g1~~TRINITY_DN8753_c0_g1_i1.p1  ORF type:complete len:472 (+),score=124.59 TRINITY_DN8753_c0_g1_i1:82-1416(+)